MDMEDRLSSVCDQVYSIREESQLKSLFVIEPGKRIFKDAISACEHTWNHLHACMSVDRERYGTLFEDDCNTLREFHACCRLWTTIQFKILLSSDKRSVSPRFMLPVFLVACSMTTLMYNIYFSKSEHLLWDEMRVGDSHCFCNDVGTISHLTLGCPKEVVKKGREVLKSFDEDEWKNLYFSISINVILSQSSIDAIDTLVLSELQEMHSCIVNRLFLEEFVASRLSPTPVWWSSRSVHDFNVGKWLRAVSSREQTDTYERFCRGFVATRYLKPYRNEDVVVMDAMDILAKEDPEKATCASELARSGSKNFYENDLIDFAQKGMYAFCLLDYYMKQYYAYDIIGRYFTTDSCPQRMSSTVFRFQKERMKTPPLLILCMRERYVALEKDLDGNIHTHVLQGFEDAIKSWLTYVNVVREGKLNISHNTSLINKSVLATDRAEQVGDSRHVKRVTTTAFA